MTAHKLEVEILIISHKVETLCRELVFMLITDKDPSCHLSLLLFWDEAFHHITHRARLEACFTGDHVLAFSAAPKSTARCGRLSSTGRRAFEVSSCVSPTERTHLSPRRIRIATMVCGKAFHTVEFG